MAGARPDGQRVFPDPANANWTLESSSNDWLTCTSQSRTLYTLAKGFFVAGATENKASYKAEVIKGANFLLQQFPLDSQYGGFVQGFYANHNIAPSDWTYDNITGKDTIGLSQVIMGLSQAFKLTGDTRYRDGAMAAWNTIDTHMRDAYGGLTQGTTRDYSAIYGGVSQPALFHMAHTFESLVFCYEATHDQTIRAAAAQMGDFMLNTMYRDDPLHAGYGYIPSCTAPTGRS